MNKDPYKIYTVLFEHFGPQNWWPARTKFEVIIGAILTQNTNWKNVERAILNLKSNGKLSSRQLYKMSTARIAKLIRPAGYYNIKAKRLKNFLNFFFKDYNASIGLLSKVPLDELRKKLLEVNGIGPETADSILLYALNKPIFVVDAYTKRIFTRHKFFDKGAGYNQIQNFFMNKLPHKVKLFNEFHALLVRLGKEICKAKPRCHVCPLKKL